MTRLTLSVPQGSGTRAFKGLLVQSSVDGRIALRSLHQKCSLGGSQNEQEEVLLLRGDFPPDCTGFVADVLSHCLLAVNLPQREAPADCNPPEPAPTPTCHQTVFQILAHEETFI